VVLKGLIPFPGNLLVADSLSRYSTLTSNYDASLLGNLSAKYLLALKYTDIVEISNQGKNLYWRINTKDWQKVHEFGSVVGLENTKYKDWVRMEDKNNNIVEYAEIVKYTPEEIIINYSTPADLKLILTDTLTDDWKAELNLYNIHIDKYWEIFKQVNIPEGQGSVRFYYHPRSFYLVKYVSGISFGI
jgi:uncharacterized membrane protein YfhO